MLLVRAELLAQELKELQAELGDYNTVLSTVLIYLRFGSFFFAVLVLDVVISLYFDLAFYAEKKLFC